jgi:hypothetical protein
MATSRQKGQTFANYSVSSGMMRLPNSFSPEEEGKGIAQFCFAEEVNIEIARSFRHFFIHPNGLEIKWIVPHLVENIRIVSQRSIFCPMKEKRRSNVGEACGSRCRMTLSRSLDVHFCRRHKSGIIL